MDNLKPLKSFLSDLITPIVKSAVGEAIPEAIKDKEKNLVPVQKITEMYGISQSKVYYMFRTAQLDKYKQGGLTLWKPESILPMMSEDATGRRNAGTCNFWPGATVFWQQDIDGRFRTGKIMLYDKDTGHRVKEPSSRIMWVHRLKMFSDFHLKQCLFGEHLLKGSTAPVAIVESEKTAAIASLFFPDVHFIATGGLNNLQSEKLRCLAWHRIILFPDLGAEEKWQAKTKEVPELRNAKISTWLMNNSTAAEKEEGLDIGDWLVRLPAIRMLRLEDYL